MKKILIFDHHHHKKLGNMKKIFYYIITFGFIPFFLASCSTNDRDDGVTSLPSPPTGVTPPTGTSSSTVATPTNSQEVNDFIWKGLNQYYYWQDKVPNLADSKKSADATAYITYLNSVAKPTDFFNSLKHPSDRFSWIQENYKNLEKQLASISASNGMVFFVARKCSGCNELVAIVNYVLIGSDAESKGIKRGDIVDRVNDKELNLNNYTSLLYGDALSYTVGRASFDPSNSTFTSLAGTPITLNKVKDFQENPIHKNLVLEQNGKKIGYLVYNSFNPSFDDQLIKVFSDFSAQGVTDLVLDLRYNLGGSGQSATYLASMITGQFTGKLFAAQIWNSKLIAYFNSLNNNSNSADDIDVNSYFVNKTRTGVPLPSLNLSTVYVLTTSRSASSSELIINGLTSHINVVTIGDNTAGKNLGSISIYDYIDNKTPPTKNPNHTYAMQPIVLKSANSTGFSDYADGLKPTVKQLEVISSLGTLGSTREPLLAIALSKITGTARRLPPKADGIIPIKTVDFKDEFGMYIDFPQHRVKELFFNK